MIFVIGFCIGLLGYVVIALWRMNARLTRELRQADILMVCTNDRLHYWRTRCDQLQNQLDLRIRNGTVPGDEWKNE